MLHLKTISKIFTITLVFSILSIGCFSQTSTINGDWTNNATWGGVTYPDFDMGSGDNVEIAVGDTVTLSGELKVRSNATLNIYGYLIVTNANGITFFNGCDVTIHSGGTLKCETGVTNNNASGITVNGSLICLGDYTAGTGSVMSGDGAIQVQGTLDVQGSADVMGVVNPGCDACNVTEAAGISNAALYEEDFSNDEGKGIDGSISNPTDSNWSISEVGNPDHDGYDDHIKVVSGVLTSRDGDGDASNYAVFEIAQVTGNYSDVSISFDYGVADGYPSAGSNGSGIIAYYKIDGGSWVEFENFQGSSFDDVSMTTTTLTGLSFSTSLDVKFHIWSRNYSYVYVYLDNIAIYGIQSTDPQISCSASLTTFSSCYGANSSEQSFTVTGSYLTDDFLTVTAPTGFEVSKTSGSGFSSSVDLAVSSGSVGSTTIYVRTNNSAVNGDGGNIACSSPDDGVTSNVATGSASITSSVYYVATTGSDSNSGLTSGSPFATIQHAIDQINVSCGSAVIYVADGTYDESNIDIDLSVTIIGDSESGTIIDNDDVNGEYCFLVTTDNADVKLQNLTIRDFKDDAGCAFKSYQHDNKIVFDAVTINSCYVNSGSTYDGVVFIYHDSGATSNDSIVIKNSTFSDNTSAEASGGCALDIGSYDYDYDYSVLLENTTFDNNDVTTSGSSYGACMIDRGYSVTVKKCTFSNNNNYYYGSGLYVSYLGSSSGVASRFTVENCLFHDNSASNGGSCTVYNVRGSVFNSTFAQNTSSNASDYYVTGLDVDGVVTAKNCIFQSDDSGNEVIQGYSGDLTISYSLLYGGSGGDSYTDGGNNLSSDPDFTNAGSNDFTLASTSPCIDAGTATGAPSDDLAGTTRDATPDLGCYEALSNEWTGAVSTAWTNSGNWSLGVVPSASDAVTIPDVTNQPEISTVVALSGLTVASGAEISLSNDLTVNGTIDLNGTMNIGNVTVNADGAFDATGGAINFTSSNGKLILSSNVISVGSLDSVMGTVEYDGVSQSVAAGNYFNLEIDVSGTKTALGDIDIDGDLLISSSAGCKLDMRSYALNVAGDVSVGAVDGLDLTDASSIIVFDGSIDQYFNHAGNTGMVINSGSNTTDYSIPDASSYAQSTINLSSSLNANDLKSVTINISHSWTSDLDITLISPNGSSIDLSSDNGSSGDNYTNTTFSTSGSSITSGSAPFTGVYTPEESFSSLTGTANGNWLLRVADDASGDTGTLLDWSIEVESTGGEGYQAKALKIDKPSGNVILNDQLIIDGDLTLSNGFIDASLNNLVLTENSDVLSSSNSSHVIGTIVKTISNTDDHEFPLGNGSVLRKVNISTSDATSRDWTVKYVDNEYSDVSTTGLLKYVSDTCYWDISPSSSAPNTTVTLNWSSSIGINDPDLSNIKLAHYDGTDWELISSTSTGVPSAGSVSGSVSSFSPFTIGTTGATPLPVTLTQFEGHVYNELDNKLEWKTVSEKNADYMEIQHSDDGVYFNTIGIEKLAGNSQQELLYEFIDRSVAKQINYYRLQQFDFDGNSMFSKTISIDNRFTTSKKVEFITNLLGQKVDKNYRGVVIVYYEDGSSMKIIQ